MVTTQPEVSEIKLDQHTDYVGMKFIALFEASLSDVINHLQAAVVLCLSVSRFCCDPPSVKTLFKAGGLSTKPLAIPVPVDIELHIAGKVRARYACTHLLRGFAGSVICFQSKPQVPRKLSSSFRET